MLSVEIKEKMLKRNFIIQSVTLKLLIYLLNNMCFSGIHELSLETFSYWGCFSRVGILPKLFIALKVHLAYGT